MQNKIVKLRTGRQGKIKPGHPWIYKRQVLKPDSSVKPGDIVSVVNSEEKFIGRGYYNPASEISVRILNFTDEAIDEKFFSSKIETAFGKRKNILI